MKARLAQFHSPFLAPNHQRNDREERNKQDSSKGKPSPEIAGSSSEWQREVADDERQAAREVEQDA